MVRRRWSIGVSSLLWLVPVAGCATVESTEQTSDELVGDRGATKVTRDSDGALRFASSIPARVADCTSSSSCADTDHDGLVDAWEDAVLDRLHPAVTFDEDEPLMHDEGKSDVFAALGRVAWRARAGSGSEPARANEKSADGHVTVNVLLLYTRDYGAPTFVCFRSSKHAGDVERVAIDLELLDDGDAASKGDAIVRAMFTTGHEGTEDDQSRVWKGADLPGLEVIDDPVTKEPRWRVYASQAKHATYATKKHCEGTRLKKLTHRFCVNEDCAPDNIDANDVPRYTRVPKILNAGELDGHRVEDLGVLGFKGEGAWNDVKFCGGLKVDRTLTREECPPTVKSKLLKDPFGS